MKSIEIIIILGILILTACGESKGSNTGTLEDSRDGKIYKTVKIGEQIWMAENLNYEAEGSKCYNDSTSYCEKYGRLYDWETAMKACPSGYYLPTEAEWNELLRYAGGDANAGKSLKATSGWDDHEGSVGNGEDKFGFMALPGASFVGWSNEFSSGLGIIGIWWGAKEAWHIRMGSDDDWARVDGGYYSNSDDLHSIRCIKGDATAAKIAEETIAATEAKKAEKAAVKAAADEAAKIPRTEEYSHTVEFNNETITMDIRTTAQNYETKLDLVFMYDGKEQTVSFSTSEDDFNYWWSDPNVISVDDYNFDDYMDIEINVSGGADNVHLKIFLYNPQTKKYVYHQELSDGVIVDREKQTIRMGGYHWGGDNGGGELGLEYYTSEHKWIDGQLTQIYSIDQKYDSNLERYIRTTQTLQDDKWVQQIDTLTENAARE